MSFGILERARKIATDEGIPLREGGTCLGATVKAILEDRSATIDREGQLEQIISQADAVQKSRLVTATMLAENFRTHVFNVFD